MLHTTESEVYERMWCVHEVDEVILQPLPARLLVPRRESPASLDAGMLGVGLRLLQHGNVLGGGISHPHRVSHHVVLHTVYGLRPHPSGRVGHMGNDNCH